MTILRGLVVSQHFQERRIPITVLLIATNLLSLVLFLFASVLFGRRLVSLQFCFLALASSYGWNILTLLSRTGIGHKTSKGAVHWAITMFYCSVRAVFDQLATSRVNG